MTSYEYAIRVDYIDEATYLMVCEYLQSHSNYWIFGYELGDIKNKPHTHWFINTDTPKQTIHRWFQRNGLTKTQRTITVVKDRVHACAYAIKKGDVQFSINFPEDLFKLSHEYDLEVKNEIKQKAKQSVFLELLDLCSDIPTPSSHDYCGHEQSYDRIVMKRIVEHFLSKNKILRSFQLKSYCVSVCCKLAPESYVNSYVCSMCLDMFK